MSFMATFSKMLMILFAISMGYLANRLKILDDGSNRKLTKLVLNITIPGLILSAVMTGEAQPEVGTVLSVWKMAAVYYAVELLALLVVPALLGGTNRQKGVWRFSLLFTNAIFIRINNFDFTTIKWSTNATELEFTRSVTCNSR